jgi:hypothetical protein
MLNHILVYTTSDSLVEQAPHSRKIIDLRLILHRYLQMKLSNISRVRLASYMGQLN